MDGRGGPRSGGGRSAAAAAGCSAAAAAAGSAAAGCLRYRGSGGWRGRLALSAVSGRGLKIEDIRLMDVMRPGMRGYEGDIVRLLDLLSEEAEVEMDQEGLTSIKIWPGGLVGCREEERRIFKCSKDRGLSYYLEFLLMIGPFCKKGVDLLLSGITDHPQDGSVDSFVNGAIPLAKKCGIEQDLQTTIIRRGLPPLGGGLVRFQCQPQRSIKPIQLVYPGRIKNVLGQVYACHLHPIFANRCLDHARMILKQIISHVDINLDIRKGQLAGKSRGLGISLQAQTLRGFSYTADAMLLKQSWLRFCLLQIRLNGDYMSPFSIELIRLMGDFLGVRFVMEELLAEDGGEIDDRICESESDDEYKELEVPMEEELKNMKRQHKELLLSCVGIGAINLSRKTF